MPPWARPLPGGGSATRFDLPRLGRAATSDGTGGGLNTEIRGIKIVFAGDANHRDIDVDAWQLASTSSKPENLTRPRHARGANLSPL